MQYLALKTDPSEKKMVFFLQGGDFPYLCKNH